MKKAISFIVATFIIFMFCFSPTAAGNESNVYSFGNTEIIFEELSQFDAETKNLIIAYLLFDDSIGDGHGTNNPENIICDIFGHKYTTETVITITHNVRETQPTCLEETYDVSVCSRCNHVESTLISQIYIYCTNH